VCAPAARSVALHPDGTTLVCAFDGRLQLFAVRVAAAAAEGEPPCSLTPKAPPEGAAPLTGVGETKCIAFSADGTLLAVGSGDGRLRVYTWPALKLRADVERAHTDAISDADFSPDGALLLTTGNEKVGPAGGAAVWRVAEDGVHRVRWLEGVRARRGARVTLRGAKFARDGSGRAYTGANMGDEARVLAWRVADWRCMSSRHALPELLTSLALSPGNGRLLAAGGAEGSVVMLSSKTLAPLRRVPAAHMVFVTGLSFSPSGRTLASLSGDASARCTLAPPRPSVASLLLRLLLTLLMHLLVVLLVLQAHRRGYLRRPAWLS
jgi:prolactin regulatory element-binding protein